MDYASMQNYLGPLYSTGGSSNYLRLQATRLRPARQGRTSAEDAGDAIKKYQQAEDILVRDMPVIPLPVRAEQLRFLDEGLQRHLRPVRPLRPSSQAAAAAA
jgi:ABC-type oligopeptide transport system substrate-binding subunit